MGCIEHIITLVGLLHPSPISSIYPIREIAQHICIESIHFPQVDPEEVVLLISNESNFFPKATNNHDSGLLQINCSANKQYCPRTCPIHRIDCNIHYGYKFLVATQRNCFDKHKDATALDDEVEKSIKHHIWIKHYNWKAPGRYDLRILWMWLALKKYQETGDYRFIDGIKSRQYISIQRARQMSSCLLKDDLCIDNTYIFTRKK